MLITKTINMRWNSKNKTRYESLGYVYTKMRDVFVINVEDLVPGSAEKVVVECDYCKTIYEVTWNARVSNFTNGTTKNDCCKKCVPIKARETVMTKYGCESIMDIPGAREKQEQTCLEKYGAKNPFQVKEIKDKIVETNLRKYGKENFTQTEEYRVKTKKTSIERYGFESYTQTEEYRLSTSGSNSPVWKGGIHDVRWDRLQPVYRTWRIEVFKKDNFTCKKCNEKKDYYEAHHILNWNDYPDERYIVENGVTFCQECHIQFHRIYGKRNNTKEQLEEYLQR